MKLFQVAGGLKEEQGHKTQEKSFYVWVYLVWQRRIASLRLDEGLVKLFQVAGGLEEVQGYHTGARKTLVGIYVVLYLRTASLLVVGLKSGLMKLY